MDSVLRRSFRIFLLLEDKWGEGYGVGGCFLWGFKSILTIFFYALVCLRLVPGDTIFMILYVRAAVWEMGVLTCETGFTILALNILSEPFEFCLIMFITLMLIINHIHNTKLSPIV